MLNFGFKRKHNSVPRSGLLLYLGRPNLEAADVPIGDDTEIGDDTIIRWMFLLPADADIRAATGWVSGTGNIFYDAAGDPVAVLASEIVVWPSINQWNVLFHLVSADTETGRLAIYAQDTPLAILNKALKVLREDQIDVSPSAFFNGMDTTGKTSYTGGPTYAPDHLGVLRSPGANLPAIEGMRLATTVADGAVLGPELVINGGFDVNTAGWTVIAATLSVVAGVLRVTKIAANGQARSSIPTVAGSSYLLLFSLPSRTNTVVTTYCQLGSVVGLTDVVNFAIAPGLPSSSGAVAFTAKSSTTYIQLYSSSATGYEEWDNISIREIIPTYLSTDLAGAPIVPSVEQKTRTGNADFSSFTPSTTFPRFDTSDPLKAPGLLCEPARTNYCLYNNELSNAAWVKTNTTAEISGASPVAGLSAWKVSAIAAASSEFRADFAMPAGAVTASVYMKKGSGPTVLSKLQLRNQITSTTISMVVVNLDTGAFAYPAGATGCNVIAVSDGWFRVNLSISIASAATIRISVGANGNHETAGSYAYLCAPQLEVGAFPTSPIPTTTATATRAGTVLSYPTAGKIRSNNMAMRKLIIPKATGQSGVYAYGTYLDANNYTALLMSPTSITLRKRVAGVDTDATVNVTHTSGVPLDIIGIRSATLGMKIAVRSYSAGTWSAWTDGAAVTTAAAKANAIIGTTYQLGVLNSVAQFTGNISLFDTLFIPTGITDPLAWAKAQWGIA